MADDPAKENVTPLRPKSAAGEETRLGRREQQRLATRERIYLTAIEEFERVGFGAAQIDRIVERAGVARGTFYFHFRTKEHVLLELQHRLQDQYVAQLAALGPPPESVADFFLQIYELAAAGRRRYPTLMNEMLAMYVRQEMGLMLMDESLIVHVVDYLSDAAERGEVRTDLTPEQLAVHFLSAMFIHFTSAPDPEAAREFTEAKIDILVRGMRP